MGISRFFEITKLGQNVENAYPRGLILYLRRIFLRVEERGLVWERDILTPDHAEKADHLVNLID